MYVEGSYPLPWQFFTVHLNCMFFFCLKGPLQDLDFCVLQKGLDHMLCVIVLLVDPVTT